MTNIGGWCLGLCWPLGLGHCSWRGVSRRDLHLGVLFWDGGEIQTDGGMFVAVTGADEPIVFAEQLRQHAIPGEAIDDALPAGVEAMARRSWGSSVSLRMAPAMSAASPRSTSEGRSFAFDDDLAESAAAGGDHRRAGGHRLGDRQAECFIHDGRRDADIGLAIILDEMLVRHVADEADTRRAPTWKAYAEGRGNKLLTMAEKAVEGIELGLGAGRIDELAGRGDLRAGDGERRQGVAGQHSLKCLDQHVHAFFRRDASDV